MQSADQHATRVVAETERATRNAQRVGQPVRVQDLNIPEHGVSSPSQDNVVSELGGEVDLHDVQSGGPSRSKHPHQSAPDTRWHQAESVPWREQRHTRDDHNGILPHQDQPFAGKLAELGQLPPEPRLGLRGRRRGVRKAQVDPAADDVLAPGR